MNKLTGIAIELLFMCIAILGMGSVEKFKIAYRGGAKAFLTWYRK